MLELLEVDAGHRVLDVGSGSGWTTALLARLVGPSGTVLGVELVPELAEWGAENIAGQDAPWASIRPADPDVLGIPSEAPFDRILVSAAARSLPDELVAQLTDDGVMVVPVNATMTRVRRTGPPRPTSRSPRTARTASCRCVGRFRLARRRGSRWPVALSA